MQNVIIVAHLLIVASLIAVILLQRSEGGGLGMGGGGGGLVSVRGSANLMTRTTGILAALFFATSIGLTILSQVDRASDSILDQVEQGSGNPALDAVAGTPDADHPDGGDMGTGTGTAPAGGTGTLPQDPASSLPVPGLPSTTTPAAPTQ
jgi:preprotein translocase subunit SecG